MKHTNGTIKAEDLQFVTMSKATETRELDGRLVFINKGRFLLQRGESEIFVLWSCCEYCNSDLDPNYNPETSIFTCSMCGAPV